MLIYNRSKESVHPVAYFILERQCSYNISVKNIGSKAVMNSQRNNFGFQ